LRLNNKFQFDLLINKYDTMRIGVGSFTTIIFTTEHADAENDDDDKMSEEKEQHLGERKKIPHKKI
jgi:hypothetical protein